MIKNLIYTSLSLVGVLVIIVTVSILLSQTLKDLESRVTESTPSGSIDYTEVAKSFKELSAEFEERMPILSLLVSDTILTEIEKGFSDVISYAEAESKDEVVTSARRLTISIEQLRELAGFTIKSIF